jgi:hypothetical protein
MKLWIWPGAAMRGELREGLRSDFRKIRDRTGHELPD